MSRERITRFFICRERGLRAFLTCREKCLRALHPEKFCALTAAIRKVFGPLINSINSDKKIGQEEEDENEQPKGEGIYDLRTWVGGPQLKSSPPWAQRQWWGRSEAGRKSKGFEILWVVFVKSAATADENRSTEELLPAWVSLLGNSTTAEGSFDLKRILDKEKTCVQFFLTFTFTGDNRTKSPRSCVLLMQK